MERGSLDLRFLVDGLDADGLDELREALASWLCREKYGADTIESLLAKWGPQGIAARPAAPGSACFLGPYSRTRSCRCTRS